MLSFYFATKFQYGEADAATDAVFDALILSLILSFILPPVIYELWLNFIFWKKSYHFLERGWSGTNGIYRLLLSINTKFYAFIFNE